MVDEDDRSLIFAGEKILLSVFDMDAEMENLDRRLLAEVTRTKIAEIIENYRKDRSPELLLTNATYALALTAILAPLSWGFRRFYHRLDKWAVAHDSRPMDFTGKPMKGFVYVAPEGFESNEELMSWVQLSLDFVISLPPK